MFASHTTESFARARVQLVTGGPVAAFYGSLAMSMIPVVRHDIKTAATDGRHVFYNPTFWDSLPEAERVGVLVHEIKHAMHLHHTRRNGRDLELYNKAADYAINPEILSDGFKLPSWVLFASEFVGMSCEDIFAVLEARENQKPQPQPKPQPGDAGAGDESDNDSESDSDDSDTGDGADDTGGADADESGDDSDADAEGGGAGEESDTGETPADGAGDADGESEGNQPGKPGKASGGAGNGTAGDASAEAEGNGPDAADMPDPGMCGGIIDAAPEHDGAAIARAEQDMAQRIRTAIASARKACGGNLPGSLARMIGELNQPRLNAREILSRFVDQSTSKHATWNRVNRRYVSRGIYLPGQESDCPAHILAYVDNSGSMDDSAVTATLSELQGALASGAADMITIAAADTQVQWFETYYPGDTINRDDIPGGGSTDFRAPLQWQRDNFPMVSAIIYLTDCEVNNWGEKPDCPILWIVTGDRKQARATVASAPFGEAIILDDY